MKPSAFITKRKPDWERLDEIIRKMENRTASRMDGVELLTFSRLYRSVCTDLSLAFFFRLPEETGKYLSRLVSSAHSNLYSFKRNGFREAADFLFRKIPVAVYGDFYVRLCLLLFYVPFILSALAAYHSPDFAEKLLGAATLESYRDMHENGHEQPGAGKSLAMSGFYIMNNISLNLITFGLGLFGGIGSLLMVGANALHLGGLIGYLLTTPASGPILSWLPGHGPFELTAIGICGGAGLRIGFSWIAPGGRSRLRAFREEASDSLPIITAAVMLTLAAAFLEAFLAPADLPLNLKFMVGGASIVFMIVYFVVLGKLRQNSESTHVA